MIRLSLRNHRRNMDIASYPALCCVFCHEPRAGCLGADIGDFPHKNTRPGNVDCHNGIMDIVFSGFPDIPLACGTDRRENVLSVRRYMHIGVFIRIHHGDRNEGENARGNRKTLGTLIVS